MKEWVGKAHNILILLWTQFWQLRHNTFLEKFWEAARGHTLRTADPGGIEYKSLTSSYPWGPPILPPSPSPLSECVEVEQDFPWALSSRTQAEGPPCLPWAGWVPSAHFSWRAAAGHVLGPATQTGLGRRLWEDMTQRIAAAWPLKGLIWWCGYFPLKGLIWWSGYFTGYTGTCIFSWIVAWGEMCTSEVG